MQNEQPTAAVPCSLLLAALRSEIPMSTDYDLKCVSCGVRLGTVASSSIAYGDKVWTGAEAVDAYHKSNPRNVDITIKGLPNV